MKQFQEAQLFELKVGDRFYFKKDARKKTVCEIEKAKDKKNYSDSFVRVRIGCKKKDFKTDQKIVYLRSTI